MVTNLGYIICKSPRTFYWIPCIQENTQIIWVPTTSNTTGYITSDGKATLERYTNVHTSMSRNGDSNKWRRYGQTTWDIRANSKTSHGVSRNTYGTPNNRKTEHIIEIEQGTKPANNNPYRYPHQRRYDSSRSHCRQIKFEDKASLRGRQCNKSQI